MNDEHPINTESVCFICGLQTDNVYSVREWIEYEREVNHATFTEDEYNTIIKYGPSCDICKDCWTRTRMKMINR